MTPVQAMPTLVTSSHRRERGFGVIAALLVLVVLAVLGGAIARMSWTQQISSAQDIDSARAQQAANAGAEWGLYQALKGSWTACASASQNIDMRATLGMVVTVTCNSTFYEEGQLQGTTFDANGNPQYAPRSLRTYLIDAVACNSPTSCPNNGLASGVGYVERRRQVQATDQ